ncbi:MAG: LysR family transcriptional regulator [Polaromonas sp.]|uniref:LysR substrate-binding domain-containing protein n=1 Tax=Polaromonas sp. TaxID=1869339 RepID=UPI0025DFB81A|nr:LysR substrate-binding domain-containing protein [Polaromonas sp.]MBI2726508.1 LysR family transcriptional regulator [Polaromonas sp.]
MKLSALQNLITVVERGSIRAAARHLDVAQPVITRSIQDLERELKVVLFERGKKGVVLTPLGKIFLRRVTMATGELRRAQEELDQLRGETSGNLVIGLSMITQITLMPSALRQFRLRYPEVSLDVIDTVFPGIESSLKEGTTDFYVGPVVENVPSELEVEQIFSTQRVIFCRKGHPLAHAKSLSDLVDAEWITASVTTKAQDEIGPLFTQHGLPPPKLVMQAHSGLTYMTALANSDLLIMLPEMWNRLPIWSSMFQAIEVSEALPERPICIVQRTGLPLIPAAEYFCDMFRRAAGNFNSA